MTGEICLQYRVEMDPRVPDQIEYVEVSCSTELSNLAHAYMRSDWRAAGVENVNFHFVDTDEKS
jgi:hypothetical protein